MNREEKIESLIANCLALKELRKRSHEKTENLQEMARLARAGKKDTPEFKHLQMKECNTVVDYGDVVNNIVKAVNRLTK